MLTGLTVHGARAGVLGRDGLGRAGGVDGQLLRREQIPGHGVGRHGLLLGRKVGRVLVLGGLGRDAADLFVDDGAAAGGLGRVCRVDGCGEEVGLFDGLSPDGDVAAVVGDEGEDEEDESICQHCDEGEQGR